MYTRKFFGFVVLTHVTRTDFLGMCVRKNSGRNYTYDNFDLL